ncbi:MAG: anhydro-N-acetylmuramic acid kinase [Pseudomonadota bacterium]
MNNAEIYIGLMSGTSLDGVDAVIADFSGSMPRQLSEAHISFNPKLREELLELSTGEAKNELECAAKAGITLAQIYNDVVHAALQQANMRATEVLAIGCHGQTVRHRPEHGFTIQLGNPSLLAELTRITVVADFRSRDMAAGGHGAPLVPAFHYAVFHSPAEDRVIVNVGGIANLTYLPMTGDVTGFDSGPGNMLMDAWALRHLGQTFDTNGAWAMTGKLQISLLEALLQAPYFHQSPPKSTGREQFNLRWLEAQGIDAYLPQDVQRTLLELTARSIAHSIKTLSGPVQQVYLSGGGAKNQALSDTLQALLQGIPVATTNALGISPMDVEALAFAWLARQTMRGEPGNLPAVTGARHSAVLGAIYSK